MTGVDCEGADGSVIRAGYCRHSVHVVMSVVGRVYVKRALLNRVFLGQGPCLLFPACLVVHWLHTARERADEEVCMNAWGISY